MEQRLELAGVRRMDLHRFALRWQSHPGGECTPHLYLDGKRVAKPWKLALEVESEGTPEDESANTA